MKAIERIEEVLEITRTSIQENREDYFGLSNRNEERNMQLVALGVINDALYEIRNGANDVEALSFRLKKRAEARFREAYTLEVSSAFPSGGTNQIREATNLMMMAEAVERAEYIPFTARFW